MICKLCLKEKPLIKKSHIIPDFMYRGIFNQKHFLVYTDLNNLKKKSRKPNGIYDKNILCNKCDNEILARLETYASKVLLPKRKSIQTPVVKSKLSEDNKYFKILHINDINYEKFKLFLLSILWRSHISKMAFFKEVDLGVHAEIIRKMIFDNNPKNNDDYEITTFLLKSKQIPLPSVIAPRYLKIDGNSSYVFLINNFMFHFNISNYNKLSMFEKTTIWNDNTMKIVILENEIANQHFDSFLGKKMRLKSQL